MRQRITSYRCDWADGGHHVWEISGLDRCNDRDDWFFLMELIGQRGVEFDLYLGSTKDMTVLAFDIDSAPYREQTYCAELIDKFCEGTFAAWRAGLRSVRTIDDWYRLNNLPIMDPLWPRRRGHRITTADLSRIVRISILPEIVKNIYAGPLRYGTAASGIPLLVDDNVPKGTAYLINSGYLVTDRPTFAKITNITA